MTWVLTPPPGDPGARSLLKRTFLRRRRSRFNAATILLLFLMPPDASNGLIHIWSAPKNAFSPRKHPQIPTVPNKNALGVSTGGACPCGPLAGAACLPHCELCRRGCRPGFQWRIISAAGVNNATRRGSSTDTQRFFFFITFPGAMSSQHMSLQTKMHF